MQLCFTDLLQYFEVGGALHLICKRPEIAINLHSGHIVTKCTWQPPLQHILPLCPTTTPFHPHHLPNPKLPPYLQCEFHTQSNQAPIDFVNLYTAIECYSLLISSDVAPKHKRWQVRDGSQGVGAEGPFEMGQVRDVLEMVQLVLSAGLQKRGNLTKRVR